MTAFSRIRVAWGGTGVTGPGVSTFYTEGDPLPLQLALKTEFNDTFKAWLPSSVTVTIPNTGETLESTTGEMTGVFTSGTALTVAGTNAGVFAAGVGARAVWSTTGVTRGRRVRGSTYMVPLAAACYQDDGTISASVKADMTTAMQRIIVACGDDMVIHSRPLPGASDGRIWTVTGVSVPDKVSWLRSRRT